MLLGIIVPLLPQISLTNFHIFHSRTMHLDIIRVFYLPTDVQESFFKNIKIYIKTAPTGFDLISVIRERIISAC
jgi:hypothetical protein